jgi:hypothetical protein
VRAASRNLFNTSPRLAALLAIMWCVRSGACALAAVHVAPRQTTAGASEASVVERVCGGVCAQRGTARIRTLGALDTRLCAPC